jgi:CubicO group peptidase (beta-lactamase class C family)
MKPLMIVLCLLAFQPLFAQPVRSGDAIKHRAHKKPIRQAERFIDSLRSGQDIPGISVCVGTKEEILWAQGFGYADLEKQGSRYPRFALPHRLGVQIGNLPGAGQTPGGGQTGLGRPHCRLRAGFSGEKIPVTTRQLAGHLAGIRHYRDEDFLYYPKRYKTVTEGLALFRDDSLLFRPGTAYAYSTHGYTLLSAVIENRSGKDFLGYLRETVFDPLGMRSTGADYPDSIVPHRVRFYEHNGGKLVNAALVDNSYKWAGGGLLSTPVDLVNLGRGLLNHTSLSAETVALLFTPQRLTDGTATGYGIGWRVGTDSKGRKVIHHGGSIDGGRTFLLLYPEENLVLAITANMSGVNINLPEAETLAAYFLSKPLAQ